MDRVSICLMTFLAVCLAGCNSQKVKDLEKENAELKKKLGEKLPPPPAMDNWNIPKLNRAEAAAWEAEVINTERTASILKPFG